MRTPFDQPLTTVTGKVYNHSKRMKEKRAVLDGIAAELRRIIGTAAEMRMAPCDTPPRRRRAVAIKVDAPTS